MCFVAQWRGSRQGLCVPRTVQGCGEVAARSPDSIAHYRALQGQPQDEPYRLRATPLEMTLHNDSNSLVHIAPFIQECKMLVHTHEAPKLPAGEGSSSLQL